jgi:hypothetical protein
MLIALGPLGLWWNRGQRNAMEQTVTAKSVAS